ncbi:branched-chain amino acid ABC transporter permease [Rhodospirillaceae bacterium KN72]|uniref:Branched-chain amino acid ABC transporter permease n=1 Tax=Pacificispira spongiicola TaxID=2729598 RepID=A0A7Y0HEV2_9PROT|nr:branched-chain amino acid ABC transporter permease [Pacificispira spongiicola]NMM43943.1 branched-chain amino acid ABC transporter permease [Pacificispira spongiicola]
MSVPVQARAGRFNAVHVLVFAGALIALGALPFAVYPVFLMKAMCFAIFACAFNLLLGFSGLLSFGHAAFFGSASYLSAYALSAWGLSAELSILFATVSSAALGAVFGAIAIRRQGIYFAMITLALSQMIYFAALQADFTGGEDGIQGVTRNPVFGLIDITDNLSSYYFVAVIFVFAMFAVYRVVHSPFGQVLRAIRESESRAKSLGYHTDQYKLVVFVISAALSGLAGGTKALVVQVASLTDVTWQMSGEVVLMTLLGGMGTVFGPAVGAVLIVTLQNFLNSFGSLVTILIGAIFVVCVMLFRRGILGELQARFGRK